MVTPTIDVTLFVEVYKVDQKLAAREAAEARRVPRDAVTRPGCEHRHVSHTELLSTLKR